jgi:DNA-binding LytR/AlgR family response regulator
LIPLRIAICEDDAHDADLLLNLVEQGGMPTKTELYESGEALLSVFCPERYDLMFLDIYINGISGIETAKVIRRQDDGVLLAFTTSSLDHTFESYRLKAVRYLLKPVQPADVKEMLELAEMKRRAKQHVTLLAGGNHVDIPLNSILYFEQEAHNIIAHTTSGDVSISRTVSMDVIEGLLPSPPFLRCHKSYLINFRHVQNIGRDFLMRDGGIAYIRRNDVKKCTVAFQNWLMDTGGDES